jgi:hypothetical protein
MTLLRVSSNRPYLEGDAVGSDGAGRGQKAAHPELDVDKADG